MSEEIQFAGETFHLADQRAEMPLLKFAHISRQGKDANEIEGLDAVYELLRSVIAEEDWDRFERAATRSRATGDELVEIAAEAVVTIANRPTSEPSTSSDGSPATNDSSAGGSSSAVVARLEAQGRPDLALVVRQAERYRASA